MSQLQKMETKSAEIIDPTLAMIERVATNPDASVDALERMMAMKKEIDAQNAKARFDEAFAHASAAYPSIPQNGHNNHNGKSYSTLNDILTVRPVLTTHGLALSFKTARQDDFLVVTARLSHVGGHSEENSIHLPLDEGAGRNKVQAVGSSQTYGQRYTAQAILGLSLGDDVEDDGRSTGKIQEAAPRPKAPTWAETVTQELGEKATPRDKAEAIATALTHQWKRMKGVKQLHLEWDRRAFLIQGEKALEGMHPDLHEKVIDAYEVRQMELMDGEG
jgi:hypothetical protein